jgi:murein L,D-transpeptidase YafK
MAMAQNFYKLRIFLLLGCLGFALSACKGELAKHDKPIPYALKAKMEKLNMDQSDPVLVRIFKEESELEVWKKDKSGRFALLETYEICKWSGEVGPKKKEGDRQAPEGFYTIRPSLMNPNSSYHLSFNLGYPNAYDQAHGYTGSYLMVHGACSSRGCYAMTDDQISDIYALAREAFKGGQRAFQVQAYPFRMTPKNMARHHDSPHMAFWRMLKEGYDHFEITKLEPKIDVCDGRYIFNAEASGSFVPTAQCPAYQVPTSLQMAVTAKQMRDDQAYQLAVAKLSKDSETTASQDTKILTADSAQGAQDQQKTASTVEEAPVQTASVERAIASA